MVVYLIKQKRDGRKYYDHNIILKNKLETAEQIQNGNTSEMLHPALKSLLQKIYSVNENSVSKVVDENGEPLVVYHGTLFSNFDVFEPGNGISFFTPTKEQAMSFGGYENAKYTYDEMTGKEDPGVFSCFLNIRNPKIVDFHGLTFNGVNVETGESEDLFTDEEAFKGVSPPEKRWSFITIH